MATARIPLDRRPRRGRRRSSRHGLLPVVAGALFAHLRRRRGGHLPLYAAALTVLAGLILNLVQVAQVTQLSYEVGRLRQQRTDLLAEQDQLRYQAVSLRAPATVQSAAGRAGMRQPAPARYLPYEASGIDVYEPLEPPTEPPASGWDRALAAVARGVPGALDALAAH